MISSLIVVLLVAFTSFLAHTPPQEGLSSNKAGPVFSEKEKQEGIRNKLAGLLSKFGLTVGSPLATSDVKTYRELRIHWESLDKADSAGLIKAERLAPVGALTRISSVIKEGAIPRERSLELSPDRMLVVALDENDAVRWWRLLIDPRLLRAEVGQRTEMQSEEYFLAKVDFVIECPDDRLLKQLRFYHPVWNGEAFQLEPVGGTPLP
jgi:hypothetical protein